MKRSNFYSQISMLPPSMSALPYMHYHKPSFPRTDKTWLGVLGCGIVVLEDQRVLRAVILADRAHILTDLAVQFAPQVNLAHVITSVVNHVIAHPDLYQYVRVTPPALLLWLVREFDIKSEAFSTPMTCFDTSTLDDSCLDNMPTFLRGVSMHPLVPNQTPSHI